MIGKTVEVGILFDFYGKLLTEKQYTAIELYYSNDLSLSEIGDRLNISRQGVFDVLKRAETNLYSYENKLELVKKFENNKNDIHEIIKESKEIKKLLKKNINRNTKIEDKLDKIIKIGNELVEE